MSGGDSWVGKIILRIIESYCLVMYGNGIITLPVYRPGLGLYCLPIAAGILRETMGANAHHI